MHVRHTILWRAPLSPLMTMAWRDERRVSAKLGYDLGQGRLGGAAMEISFLVLRGPAACAPLSPLAMITKFYFRADPGHPPGAVHDIPFDGFYLFYLGGACIRQRVGRLLAREKREARNLKKSSCMRASAQVQNGIPNESKLEAAGCRSEASRSQTRKIGKRRREASGAEQPPEQASLLQKRPHRRS